MVCEMGTSDLLSPVRPTSSLVREIEVVVAHSERVTLRVGDVFLKTGTDQTRIGREPQDAARVRVDRAAFRQGHDMQQQVTPGARGFQPQAEHVSLVQRHIRVVTRVLVPPHRLSLPQLQSVNSIWLQLVPCHPRAGMNDKTTSGSIAGPTSMAELGPSLRH
jgi:hypothetical protein